MKVIPIITLAVEKMFSTKNKKDTITIDISWSLIFKVLLTIGLLMVGLRIIQVAIIIFVAYILASAFMPIVKFFETKKVPTVLAIVFSYLSATVIIVFLLAVIVQPILSDFSSLVSSMPDLIDKTVDAGVEVANRLPFGEVDKENALETVNNFYNNYFTTESIMKGAGATLSTITSVGGAVASFFISVILSVYIIIDHDTFLNLMLMRIIDDDQRELVKELVYEVEEKLGRWLISELGLILIIGSLSWIVLMIFGVKFALPLAALAGILTMIPSVGTATAAIPAILIVIIDRGIGWGIAVWAAFTVLQQIDGAFITPRIMGNVAGIKPVVVIIGIMVGFSLGGFLGAMLTIPIFVMAKILYESYVKFKRLKVMGGQNEE